ncbi:hypothetical protein BDDG_13211 [Blastomyces dermatitidis ATCC 18188]|uniref:Uncharacterized protein n=1 Tax=Ajellomyces dermatitidis (strain ATCC 18188 / CBS 674.68) TaxID=653446 RepID=A0A0J9ERU4_AJEDA|nr:hypothetical protein BDDG_13211 [Blastomyces dermatitidis ATCC 18188]
MLPPKLPPPPPPPASLAAAAVERRALQWDVVPSAGRFDTVRSFPLPPPAAVATPPPPSTNTVAYDPVWSFGEDLGESLVLTFSLAICLRMECGAEEAPYCKVIAKG